MHPIGPTCRLLRRLTTGVVALAVGLTTTLGVASPAHADNPVTPGDFTGYGFDQCLAPTQSAMDTWWLTSPFTGVGIYVSGASRACTSQPNLTSSWISRQLAAGWRLLPITLGPQAWCTTRERYLHQVRIDWHPANNYVAARTQGRAEADKTIAATSRLGIAKGSTQWYDIEAFDTARTDCRESAKWFLNAWSNRLHELGYVSGVYSSAASGIKMLDDARVNTPGRFTLPDQLWIADWNGNADVFSSYVRNDGWMPHRRVHQYRGGKPETFGGVTINIDRNWLDLGRGSVAPTEAKHCGGAAVYNYPSYANLQRGTTRTDQVRALQCMLQGRGVYNGAIDGKYGDATVAAVRAYRKSIGWQASDTWSRHIWMQLMTVGPKPVVKYGSARSAVRKVQRALNASGVSQLTVTGVMTRTTVDAVKRYQGRLGIRQYGVVTPGTWRALNAGRF